MADKDEYEFGPGDWISGRRLRRADVNIRGFQDREFIGVGQKVGKRIIFPVLVTLLLPK